MHAIDLQPKVMQAIVEANGGHTKYMSSGAASQGVSLEHISIILHNTKHLNYGEYASFLTSCKLSAGQNGNASFYQLK